VATSVPLSDNTACAAFTSTPERAHQKPNITVADVSEISASEHGCHDIAENIVESGAKTPKIKIMLHNTCILL
jgi:hypothetical protein